MADDILDFAIVGGGISGIYTAWRLLKQNPDKRIAVFEADDHIGGRLLSLKAPHINTMVAELGGMRFLPELNVRLSKLIEVLNQEHSPLGKIKTYPFPVSEPNNIVYIRGSHLQVRDFTEHPEKIPYKLSSPEQAKAVVDILITAIEQIVPGITIPSLDDKQRRKMTRRASFNGRPLYQQGFWQVLVCVLSSEAYHLAVDAFGYQSILANWNAAAAIPWFLADFGLKSEYQGFKQGFQQIPLILEDLFRKLGGTVRVKSKLHAFEWNKAEKYLKLKVQVRHMSVKYKEFKTKALILAMPRRALEIVAEQSPLLQKDDVRKLIGSVSPHPLFKLFTTYKNPWWTEGNFQKGRAISDLPLRQTYYWLKNDGTVVSRGRAMLLASYDDGNNPGFWDGFRPKRSQPNENLEHYREKFVGEDDADASQDWQRYVAPKDMVEEIQRQLKLIHDMPFIPDARSACFRDWGDDPFGGGWNTWNIGVKYWEVKKKMIQPLHPIPLYICGEAYSDWQGWVEGALETADLMLKKHFNLVPLLKT
jgi:monoamine oxidase